MAEAVAITAAPATDLAALPTEELEAIVSRGVRTFMEVGSALKVLHDRRAYLERGYGSFDDYCRALWSFSRQHGYRLIVAVETAAALSVANGDTDDPPLPPPANEAQVRALAPLKDRPVVLAEAWRRATETAPNGKITAQHVTRVVETVERERLQAEEQRREDESTAEERRRAERGAAAERRARENEARRARDKVMEEQRAAHRARHTRDVALPAGVAVPVPASVPVVYDADETDPETTPWEEVGLTQRYLRAARETLHLNPVFRTEIFRLEEAVTWAWLYCDPGEESVTVDEAGVIAVYVATAEACLKAAAEVLEGAAARATGQEAAE